MSNARKSQLDSLLDSSFKLWDAANCKELMSLRLLLEDQRRLPRQINPQLPVVRVQHALGVGAHALPSAICRILQMLCIASGMGAPSVQRLSGTSYFRLYIFKHAWLHEALLDAMSKPRCT